MRQTRKDERDTERDRNGRIRAT